MIGLAAAHPASTRLGLVALGIAFFAAVATVRQSHRVPTLAVVVLTALASGWLVAATLVWDHGTSIRWDSVWVLNTSAWQWTALLAIAYLGVISTAATLRAFARGRTRPGWWGAALAFVTFIGWSAVVNFSIVLAAIAAGIALAAISAAAPPSHGQARIVPFTPGDGRATGLGRVPLTILATVAALIAMSLFLISQIPTAG